MIEKNIITAYILFTAEQMRKIIYSKQVKGK